MEKREPEKGVYYDHADYLGLGRRFLIDLVDVAVVTLASLVLTLPAVFLLDGGALTLALFVAWPGVWLGYFVLLKSSPLRTLGYVVAGARIVNLAGGRPSIPSLTIRFLFALFGPLNLLFDLLWIPSDPAGQALRDKFAHTYVIRNAAQPKGTGRVAYVPYTILGGSFLFCEVAEPRQPATAP